MIEITSGVLEDFLEALGRCYRHHGRLYLVGGSSLILVSAKVSTLDVDIEFTIDPEHQRKFMECVRSLSLKMKIPVERAAPEHFIPLPKGYESRHQFIGRYGSLDVFHYDFYAIALSKIYRGNEKDFTDVKMMILTEMIELSQLNTYFLEILPEVDLFRLNSSSTQFQRHFNLLLQLLDDE